MKDEFYHLTVKGNNLKTYVRRFQELETLCPTMVPDSGKMMEVFIGGLPQSIEGNVTTSKPLTLEEAINIAQRLINQRKWHYANQCRKTTNNNSQGIAYMLRDRNAHQDPNVVTVSSDDDEVTEVKALMALTDEERVSVRKESANNGEWVKISIQKVHTFLEIDDNNDRKSFLDYFCIDLNYVKEQQNNLLSKHRNLVHELNTCKEQLLVLKQAKLDLLTMQHVNTEILKENQNLRNELKELTSITEAWLNSSNKVNQCISEQIPTQKKKILGIDQLTEDTSSSGPKDPVFVKSSADNSEVSITGSNKPKLSEAEDSTLSNHDTGKHPLPPLEKLTGAEPVSGPKTIKSILKSKSTFKAETLKGITINEPSSAPARGNKSSSVSKTNSAPAGKLKNVKIEDDPPLAIVMKELNELKLQISKNKSSYFRNKNSQQNGVNILKSIDEGPFQMGTFRETLAEGNEGALHLGLPKDIYSLINHYTDAKDIWYNVKMLLEGSELTKEDRESQLYDDFEHFRQNKGDTIHDYYLRFAKLINDMQNIKMTMSRMQMNSKFVNNMLPEWGQFVTTVKLNRGLRDSNYDQLYAYLKQHEAYANENKMMLD
ncbi:hypothetical protein Tco_0779201 [Tanacetum coccineum]